jgi:hypothetical protein
MDNKENGECPVHTQATGQSCDYFPSRFNAHTYTRDEGSWRGCGLLLPN